MLGLFNRKRRFREGALLTQSTGTMDDLFGFSVALSADGNTTIVGASGDNASQGSSTIFIRSGGVWVQQQTITQTGGGNGDGFGFSVALSNDGNTAIVGAPYDDIGANGNQGSATIFTRSGTTWTQQQTITQTGGAANDSFGWSVALSSDGNTAIVGVVFDTSPAGGGVTIATGSAAIFTRSGSVWTEQQTIKQSNYAGGDQFGYSVALSDDGNTAIIGNHKDDVGTNTDQGSATIFTRSASVWTQQQTITKTSAAGSDEFGTSVALSANGNIAIVGAPKFDGPVAGNQGSATIFIRSGSVWTELQTINKSNGASNDRFGTSVALSSDGNTAIVGTWWDDEARGSATIFTRSLVYYGEQQTITKSVRAANDYFGYSVALSSSGNTAIIGAYGNDISPFIDQGSATIFYRR